MCSVLMARRGLRLHPSLREIGRMSCSVSSLASQSGYSIICRALARCRILHCVTSCRQSTSPALSGRRRGCDSRRIMLDLLALARPPARLQRLTPRDCTPMARRVTTKATTINSLRRKSRISTRHTPPTSPCPSSASSRRTSWALPIFLSIAGGGVHSKASAH